MFRFFRALRLAPALLLALVVNGCEPSTQPQQLTAPEAVASLSSSTGSFVRLQGQPAVESISPQVSTIIGVDGGSLHLGGHRITVPAGAVEQPTVFTVTLPLNGLIEVDLTALRTDALGQTVDVGAAGFANGKRVTLTLSYAGATNLVDAEQLRVLYLLDDGTVQPLNSVVDTQNKTVSAQLDHFSRYALGYPH